MSQAILDVRDLRKSYAAKVLFDGVTFFVSEGEKVGIIGRNGSGKTTLFEILAGIEGYEEGVIARRQDLVVGYLPQDPQIDPTHSVFETVSEGRAQVSDTAADWEWNHRIARSLTQLQVEGWDRKMGELSGGERRRVALARTFLSEPELLLLDEPTNHLDADTVLWLEEILFDFRGAVLVITHDRYFLDRVVDRMIEISNGVLTSYSGGYTEYLETRAECVAREEAEDARRVRFLERELAWARKAPPARTGKQKARRRRVLELASEQWDRERTRQGEVEIDIGGSPRQGHRVVDIHDLSFHYGDKVVIENFSDRLLAGERVGVIGPNGVGKTTLLRILTGEEFPKSGSIVLGENTRIGYFDQDREIDPTLSVERAVSKTDWVSVGGRSIHLRAYLERFLFPPHVQRQRVDSLSGGERNRLLLARLLLQEFNLLILDEPTNDLDLDTLRVLEEALESFSGCVVMVTHDRYLLDKLATSLWVFEGGGEIYRHHGGWDSYLARREKDQESNTALRREKEQSRQKARAEVARMQAKAARSDPKRLSYNEQRELEGMDARIAGVEVERDELSGLLGNPEFYRGEAARVSAVTTRYNDLEKELKALYNRWMDLEERA